MEKESNFNFTKEELRIIRNIIKPERRVVIGFNENQFGEAVVTTGVPVQYQPDKVSYEKVKTAPYERYMFDEQQKMAKRR